MLSLHTLKQSKDTLVALVLRFRPSLQSFASLPHRAVLLLLFSFVAAFR